MSEKDKIYNDCRDNFDLNVFCDPDSRKISVLEEMLDPSFGSKLKVSYSDREIKTVFDEELLGETTIRFYRIQLSKINALFYTKNKEAKTLCRETSVADLEVKSDVLRNTSVKSKTNLASAPASITKDELTLEYSATECLDKEITPSITKKDEFVYVDTAKSNVTEHKLGIQQERIPSSFSLGRKFSESLPEPNFSELWCKTCPEFQTEAVCVSDETATEHVSVYSSETPTSENSFRTQTIMQSSERLTKLCCSKDKAENCHFKGQDKQAVSEVQYKECLLQFNTHCHSEDPDETSDSTSQSYRPESQSEERYLENQKEEFLPDTQTGRRLLVDPGEEHHSHFRAKTHLSDFRTGDSLSLAAQRLPDLSVEDYALDIAIGERLPDSQILTHLSDGRDEERLRETPNDDPFSGTPLEESHLNSQEKDLSDLPTKQHPSCNRFEECFQSYSTQGCLSHALVKQSFPAMQKEKNFSNSTSEKHLQDAPSEEYLSDILAAQHVLNNPDEANNLEIRMKEGSSEVEVKEISKTQIEVFKTRVKIPDTRTDHPESEKESSEAPDETCCPALDIQECFLKIQNKIPEVHANSSQIQKEEHGKEIRSKVGYIPEAKYKGHLSEVRLQEVPAVVPVEELKSGLSSVVEAEESVSEVQIEPINAQSDPVEGQTEKQPSLSPRVERLFDDFEDKRCSRTAQTLSGAASAVDPAQEFADERELLKKQALKDESAVVSEIVPRTADEPHVSSALRIRRKLKIKMRSSIKSVGIYERKQFPRQKDLQNTIVGSSDHQGLSDESEDPGSVPDDSSEEDSDQVSDGQLSDVSATENLAYCVGDKIYEFSPFVHVLDSNNIKSRCSSCFTVLKSTQMVKCNACSLAFYCDKDCQEKHLETHRRECPYLRKILVSELPNPIIRLAAHVMWKLKDPLSHKICETVGEKTYYYQDLPLTPQFITSNSSASESVKSLNNEYDLFRKYVAYDDSISFEDFRTLYAKMSRNTLIIREDPHKEIGLGMYFGLAALKFSCCPNANIGFIGTTARIVATCDIGVVDRHAVTIRHHFFMAPRLQRQAAIKLSTGELCNCELCKNDEFEDMINEVKGGEPSFAIINSILNTWIQRKPKYDEEDLKMASEALRAMRGVAGVFHYVRGKMIEIAAASCVFLQRYTEALPYYRQLLDAYRFYFGTNNGFTITALQCISMLYRKLGHPRKSRKYLAKAVQAAYRTYGSDHPFFQYVRYSFIVYEECNWEDN